MATSKRILWQMTDGSVRITTPVEPPAEGESEGQYIDKIALGAQSGDPDLLGGPGRDPARRLPDVRFADLPTTRRWRDCWRHDGLAVTPDVALTRAQVLAEVRAERNALLDQTDKDAARLADVGTPAQVRALKAYRQALRDLPTSVGTDLAALTTISALQAYNPTWPTEPTNGN